MLRYRNRGLFKKDFDAVFTFWLWMLRYRSRRKFSARCLLFALKPCGTGVEDNAEKITPESATADHLKRKAKNKCRFLRGAGFGNLVERFFENPCRFFCPSCCCTEEEGRAEYSLSLPAKTTLKKYFQKISKFLKIEIYIIYCRSSSEFSRIIKHYYNISKPLYIR